MMGLQANAYWHMYFNYYPHVHVPCSSGSLASVMWGCGGSSPSKLTLCAKDCGSDWLINSIWIKNDGINVSPVNSSTVSFWS